MFPQVLRMTLSKGSIPSPSRQPPYSARTPDLRPNLSVLVAWDNRDTAHLAADYLENRGHPNRTPRWTNRAACMGRPPRGTTLARQALEPEGEPFVAEL
jgi:hypothetical protein